jgi:Tfp pilus assembly protein PilF
VNSIIQLASQHIDTGRHLSDERYFGYAAALLQPWRSDKSAPLSIQLLLADIAQHQHRFNESLAILDGIILRDSTNAKARLMRATVAMALSQPQLARVDCQKLFALHDWFVASVCSAQISGLTGKLAAGYQLVATLIDRTAKSSDPVVLEQLSWAHGIAAEMAARQGHLDMATSHLEQALSLTPTSLPLRLQLCDLMLRKQDARRAEQLLQSVSPTEPVLLRRALIAKQLHQSSNSDALQAWQDSVAQSKVMQVELHLRELARGQLELLNDPNVAVQTALRNWQMQREPEDARLLALAGKASGNGEALRLVREWQHLLQIEDAGLSL